MVNMHTWHIICRYSIWLHDKRASRQVPVLHMVHLCSVPGTTCSPLSTARCPCLPTPNKWMHLNYLFHVSFTMVLKMCAKVKCTSYWNLVVELPSCTPPLPLVNLLHRFTCCGDWGISWFGVCCAQQGAFYVCICTLGIEPRAFTYKTCTPLLSHIFVSYCKTWPFSLYLVYVYVYPLFCHLNSSF